MIPQHILDKFNPHTKIKFKDYRDLRTKLEPYADMINVDEGSAEKAKEKNDFSTEWLKVSLEMQGTIKALQGEVKTKLVKDFFSLSQAEFDELGEEFLEMYEMIIQARPTLIDFLFLEKPKEKVKPESQPSDDSLASTPISTSSQATPETTPPQP